MFEEPTADVSPSKPWHFRAIHVSSSNYEHELVLAGTSNDDAYVLDYGDLAHACTLFECAVSLVVVSGGIWLKKCLKYFVMRFSASFTYTITSTITG